MRTIVLKAMATVALFVTGLTSAGAQERTQNPSEVLPTEVLPSLVGTIQNLDIPESQKSRALSGLPRIVGGFPTSIEINPWQVALIQGLVAEPVRSQFCGGSIIDPEWVITAAHCMDNLIVNKTPARVNVVAGTTRYKEGGQRIAVKRIVVHPAWNREKNDNDVALLQLSRRLTSTPSMRAVQLVAAGTAFAAPIPLQVTGWGATSEGGSGSDALLAAIVPLVPNNVCNAPDSYAGRVTANMFCAGNRDGGRDSCQGDSGGPIWTTIDGKQTLVGVVSFGDGCARRLKYGIYTRLANYTAWAQLTMRGLREEVAVAGGEERPTAPPETPMADNELAVNASEWSQLPEEERARIEVILRQSRLIEPNVKIVPTGEPRMMSDGDPRLCLSCAAKWVCKRGCEAAAVTAVAGCGTLTAGVGVAVCSAVAERGQALCKKKCG
jgi:secreted trypsin-like serine protease